MNAAADPAPAGDHDRTNGREPTGGQNPTDQTGEQDRAGGQDRSVSRAARVAAAIALPVALLAGTAVFWLLGGVDGGPSSVPTSGPVSTAPTGSATGPVTFPAAPLDERQTIVCRALLAKLPQRIRDREQRPVTAGPEQNAAWGDPPLTLTCGASVARVPAEAPVWLLNGVCWFHHDATAWTTVDREVPVTVTVPASYGPGGQWVIDFSDPIIEAVRSISDPPAGCR